MNTKYMTDGALLVGPVVPIGDIETGERFVAFPENLARFMSLVCRFRVRRHQDGWFVDGKGHRSQIWEYGYSKLGLTVVGPKLVGKCLREGRWLNPKSVGNDEANFWCIWSDENLALLTDLVCLQRRKASIPPARRSAISQDSLVPESKPVTSAPTSQTQSSWLLQ